MPCLLNDKLSPWAARSVNWLRGLVNPRNHLGRALEVERQIVQMRPAQRRLVRRSVERRNLHSLCQLLGSLGGGERLDDGAELIAQKDAVVGGVETDTVVGHAILRSVIGCLLYTSPSPRDA